MDDATKQKPYTEIIDTISFSQLNPVEKQDIQENREAAIKCRATVSQSKISSTQDKPATHK